MEFPGFVSVAASGVAVYRKEMAAEWPPPARLAVSQESVPEWHPPEEPLPENIKPAWRTERECPPAVALELAAEPADILAAAGDRFAVGRFSEARGVLLSASDGWCGTDPQAAMMLVQCHANLGELAEALIWCERALTVTKTDPILHYLHASILQELERDEDALRVLRNVLFLDPGHVLAHFTMANLHRRSGDATAAARHLANVRQLLFQLHPDEELPQSGGLTVDCMNALLAAMTVPSATTKGLAHE